jgi:A/G-specific adenine glycosylase
MRAALLAHYDAHRREMPWRGETDPYRIWVSEVMLQQTRVETVRERYGPFLARFPHAARSRRPRRPRS